VVIQVDGALPAPAGPDRVLDRSLADTDPEVADAIAAEPA
jgi:glycine hydroxymethyltransferase